MYLSLVVSLALLTAVTGLQCYGGKNSSKVTDCAPLPTPACIRLELQAEKHASVRACSQKEICISIQNKESLKMLAKTLFQVDKIAGNLNAYCCFSDLCNNAERFYSSSILMFSLSLFLIVMYML